MAWSKDSTRFIFKISTGDPEIGISPARSKDEEDFLENFLGYYLIDFARNTIKKINIPSGVRAIIPLSATEFLLDGEEQNIDRLEIFDARTLRIKQLYDLKGYYGQYSIDQSGRNWSFAMSVGIGADTSVIYGKFPSLEGEIIAQGAWAEFQWPVISPDGEKVLFVKAVDPRFNMFSLAIYDSENHSSRVLVDTSYNYSARYWPEVWIDNERFIFSRMSLTRSIFSRDFLLYNLRDNSIQLLSKGETTRFISKEEAINLVKNLPEIKKWLALFTGPGGTAPTTGGKPMIVVDSKTDLIYTIHVYEDMPDHAATFDWYTVNAETGKINVGIWQTND